MDDVNWEAFRVKWSDPPAVRLMKMESFMDILITRLEAAKR